MNSVQKIPFLDQDKYKKILGKLEELLASNSSINKSKKVLVLGDVGLDSYYYGEVDRISPEAPVPVIKVLKKESKMGLAANVSKNLSSLGLCSDLVSLVGQDETSKKLLSLIKERKNIGLDFILESQQRPTTVKVRVLSGQHHLLRMDEEESSALSLQDLQKAQELLNKVDFSSYSCVILEDYNKGFLAPSLCRFVIEEAQKAEIPVLVDPSSQVGLEKFEGASLFKPNKKETLAYKDKAEVQSYEELVKWVLQKGDFGSVMSTLGPDGMLLVEEGKSIRIPTFAKKVFDVTGAGDTVIATLAFALSQGLTLVEAAVLANFAAGHVVSKVGAVACTKEDILHQLRSRPEILPT